MPQAAEPPEAWAAILAGVAHLCAGLAAQVAAGTLEPADLAQALPRVPPAPRPMARSSHTARWQTGAHLLASFPPAKSISTYGLMPIRFFKAAIRNATAWIQQLLRAGSTPLDRRSKQTESV